MITFLRRPLLGSGSIRGMSSYLTGYTPREVKVGKVWTGGGVQVVRNDYIHLMSDTSLLVRWGCTSSVGVPLDNQLNTSQAIHLVNDKIKFRQVLLDNNPTLVPKTYIRNIPSNLSSTLVVRPSRHAQGRNLFVVNNLSELVNVLHEHRNVFSEGWYASELIDKVAEYRVYVVSGRVATVAQKTPDNPNAVAWNVARGGRFDVVSWGDWPLEVVRAALESFSFSGLDFGGVDVMVDRNGKPYVLEINSAPSLPLLSDGSVSYRQKCMAKCFKYIYENGKEHFDQPDGYDNWRQVIHPAINQTQ